MFASLLIALVIAGTVAFGVVVAGRWAEVKRARLKRAAEAEEDLEGGLVGTSLQRAESVSPWGSGARRRGDISPWPQPAAATASLSSETHEAGRLHRAVHEPPELSGTFDRWRSFSPGANAQGYKAALHTSHPASIDLTGSKDAAAAAAASPAVRGTGPTPALSFGSGDPTHVHPSSAGGGGGHGSALAAYGDRHSEPRVPTATDIVTASTVSRDASPAFIAHPPTFISYSPAAVAAAASRGQAGGGAFAGSPPQPPGGGPPVLAATGPTSLLGVVPRHAFAHLARNRYTVMPMQSFTVGVGSPSTPAANDPRTPSAVGAHLAAPAALLASGSDCSVCSAGGTHQARSPSPPIPLLPLQRSGISTGPPGFVEGAQRQQQRTGSLDQRFSGAADAAVTSASPAIGHASPQPQPGTAADPPPQPRWLTTFTFAPPLGAADAAVSAAAGQRHVISPLPMPPTSAALLSGDGPHVSTQPLVRQRVQYAIPAPLDFTAQPPPPLPLHAGPPIFGPGGVHSPTYVAAAASSPPHRLQRIASDELSSANAASLRNNGTSASGLEGRTPLGGGSHYEIAFESLQLGRLVGEGGFGRVFKARWRGSTVAVKMLSVRSLSLDVVADFRSEVAVLSALRHPNILLFMGACTAAPNYALVTEFLPRGSVWNLLHDAAATPPQPLGVTRAIAMSRGGGSGRATPTGRFNSSSGGDGGFVIPPPPAPLDMRLVLRMALDVARGMAYLHSADPPILHRDLKSANLLVDDAFNIRIADFGLARLKASSSTMTGACGTLAWMSPEVLANER